jgi:hypothetical protein
MSGRKTVKILPSTKKHASGIKSSDRRVKNATMKNFNGEPKEENREEENREDIWAGRASREDFKLYRKIQNSGLYNMIGDVKKIIAHHDIKLPAYLTVLKHYSKMARALEMEEFEEEEERRDNEVEEREEGHNDYSPRSPAHTW